MMVSSTTLTVLFGFYAVFCCAQLIGGEDTMAMTMTQDASSQTGGLARVAGAALVPAVLATLVLTPILTFAHVGELVRANKAGAGARLVTVLARATLLAATVALMAGAVVQLGADGHLDRGRDDVARLNIK